MERLVAKHCGGTFPSRAKLDRAQAKESESRDLLFLVIPERGTPLPKSRLPRQSWRLPLLQLCFGSPRNKHVSIRVWLNAVSEGGHWPNLFWALLQQHDHG